MARSANKVSFVYFIGAGQYTKIGKADDVNKRMATLQSGSPVELHLMAVFSTLEPFDLESALHASLKEYRVKGEWFDIPPSVLRATFRELWAHAKTN